MSRKRILDKDFETSYTQEVIEAAVAAVGRRMNADLAGREPLFLCVLNGAFMFASDLMKHVDIPCQISFVKLASYSGTQSTGAVKELIGLNESLAGRTVVIVEDIVDTGMTMEGLVRQVKGLGASEVRVATLLYKPGNCVADVKLDYVGLEIPNDFIVGYGLDYDGFGRNIPEIMTLVKD